jgi:hypothetical protein
MAYTERMARGAARIPENRVFLLSPAHCGGRRAQLVMSPRATFPLAARLRSPTGAPLGEVMSFLSGLYFRGKLAYARTFGRPPAHTARATAGGVLIITAHAGLVASETAVTVETLRAAAGVPISADNPVYRRPLETTARALDALIGAGCEVVLLGSIASTKYVDALAEVFGSRLRFPVDFVGRGDMSRGGLLLRCVAERRELAYVPLEGAVRHGPRPPKLPPVRHLAARAP